MSASSSAELNQTEVTRAIKTPLDRPIQAIAARFGGNKAREVERFLKFAVVGTIGAVVDFGTLNLLQATILPPDPAYVLNVPIAVTISFIAAVLSNFTWNRYWTYPDSRTRSVRRQLAQFAFVSVVGWIGRTTWVTLSFAFMGKLVTDLIQTVNPVFEPTIILQNRLGTNLSLLIGVFVVMIWNFFVNRYWTYNDVD